MVITLIFSGLFVLTGALYFIFGDKIDRNRHVKNLDMTLDGLFKALGIATLCVGLMSAFTGTGEDIKDDSWTVTASALADEETETTQQDTITKEPQSEYSNGVFTGSGRGFKGTITVEVEIDAGDVTRVEVVEHRDDRKWFDRANRVVPQSIIEAQSADVDTVSGATYTSLGIIEGAAEALSKSRGQ